ncbi:MAG: alcohol dehydrogenase catalytic domain-containing protein [Actinomycetia bacterium]|nr:alcohol dehydrogenase catalytic domain-containing protein [Actinomycetes bacterium]
MKALQFMGPTGPEPWPTPIGPDEPPLMANLATTPMALVDLPDPEVLGADWVVVRNRLTGICGSDIKQVLMDFDGAADNMMTAFISFPQVLGHEVVGTLDSVGSAVDGLEVGQRVVLYPNIGCRARGIAHLCVACAAGDFSLCENWWEGDLEPGIHSGNSVDATGGFADLVPAHRSMVHPVPDGIPDEVAVLADPWSVSFHAITRNPPRRGSRVVVYGAGALGTTATAILTQLYECEVAVVARWPVQAELAAGRGAHVVTGGPDDALAVVEQLADWSGATLRVPWEGLPVAYPGTIDTVYDTVGSPLSVEVSMRLLATRGTLVQLGVGAPGRFEWTPWYFKELRLVGSNAFGRETFEGATRHAYDHFFDLLAERRIEVDGMLTHTWRLSEWREAFTAIVHGRDTGTLKVAFDFR